MATITTESMALEFASPESLGLDPALLDQIEQLMISHDEAGSYPGGQ